MSKKIISIFLLGSLILTSCGKTAPIEKVTETKRPFLIDTKNASEFAKSYTIEKSGRLVGSSTISLASQGV